MKFEINNSKWEIIQLENKKFYDIRRKLKEQEEQAIEDENFVFGFTCYSNHKIYLNKNQCNEELKRTLIHELTHCWLWSYGASYSSYSEEAVCETLSASYMFMNETIKNYFKEK